MDDGLAYWDQEDPDFLEFYRILQENQDKIHLMLAAHEHIADFKLIHNSHTALSLSPHKLGNS